MRFRGLDLNLLVAFKALMQTRSVTRAAEDLNMSQPAMSSALGRLRDFFGDELLVAHNKRMHPTAFAEGLLPQVTECLGAAEAILATPTGFDPATSHRLFRIVTSDYVVAAVLHPLVAGLATKAPNVRLEITLPGETALEAFEQGKVDLMLSPDYVITGDHPSQLLYEDEQMVVGWSQNPLFSRPLTEEDFFSAGHVAVAFGTERVTSFADRQLELQARKRRVEVVTPFFTAVPWVLEGTMRLAILHRRLVDDISRRFDIAYVEPPFEIPPLKQHLYYHEAREQDEGLRWLRNELLASLA